jgi:polysaccharide export outer membrane protein
MINLLSRTCFLVALAAAVAACSPGAGQQEMPAFTQNGYRLGSGDQVRVITFGVDQLSGQFHIDDQGNIAMPLVGSVHAAGLTATELGGRLSARMKSGKFVREPSVSVEVLAYRAIFVLGEVAHPGQYPYQPGMTMLTAVAVAGGFTYRAVEDYASDIRTVDGPAVTGKILPSSFLAPGDVVKIYERHF